MRRIIIFLLLTTMILGEEDINNYLLRVLYGRASYSSLGDLTIRSDLEWDHQDETIFGIELERYIKRGLFKDKLDIGLQGGLIMHDQKIINNGVPYNEPLLLDDGIILQINAGIKFTWTKFPWNKYLKTKLSFLEGVSYISDYINIEKQNFNRGTLENQSKFLNYLELTLSFHLEDILRLKQLKDSYIGLGISHRSGIFGTINDVDGGSNILMVFLEREF